MKMTYPIKDECISHTLFTTKMAEDLTPGGERVYRYVCYPAFSSSAPGKGQFIDLTTPSHSPCVYSCHPCTLWVLRLPSLWIYSLSCVPQAFPRIFYKHPTRANTIIFHSLYLRARVFSKKDTAFCLKETLSTILDPN